MLETKWKLISYSQKCFTYIVHSNTTTTKKLKIKIKHRMCMVIVNGKGSDYPYANVPKLQVAYRKPHPWISGEDISSWVSARPVVQGFSSVYKPPQTHIDQFVLHESNKAMTHMACTSCTEEVNWRWSPDRTSLSLSSPSISPAVSWTNQPLIAPPTILLRSLGVSVCLPVCLQHTILPTDVNLVSCGSPASCVPLALTAIMASDAGQAAGVWNWDWTPCEKEKLHC